MFQTIISACQLIVLNYYLEDLQLAFDETSLGGQVYPHLLTVAVYVLFYLLVLCRNGKMHQIISSIKGLFIIHMLSDLVL